MTSSPHQRAVPSPAVGVIGLGVMGAPVARNLLHAGFDVTVWNRSPAPAAELAAVGARRASNPAGVAVPVVLSLLPDVPQLKDLLHGADGLLAGLGEIERPRLVVMSTTSPEAVRGLGDELGDHGVAVVDAPMSGGDQGAREATMSIMAGGAAEDFATVRPVLETVGGTVLHMGGLGAGSLMKLCNQVAVAGILASTAEALALAEDGGLDLHDAVRVLAGGLADSAALALKRDKFLTGRYSVGGSAANHLKDLRYATQTFVTAGGPSPVTALATQLFLEIERRGWGERDHSVVFELFRKHTGGTEGTEGTRE